MYCLLVSQEVHTAISPTYLKLKHFLGELGLDLQIFSLSK